MDGDEELKCREIHSYQTWHLDWDALKNDAFLIYLIHYCHLPQLCLMRKVHNKQNLTMQSNSRNWKLQCTHTLRLTLTFTARKLWTCINDEVIIFVRHSHGLMALSLGDNRVGGRRLCLQWSSKVISPLTQKWVHLFSAGVYKSNNKYKWAVSWKIFWM